MKRCVFLAALLFSTGSYAKWETYFPAKLADGVSIASRAGHGGFVVFREGYAFRSNLVYAGEIRPLSTASRQVLSGFFKLSPDFPTFDARYANEVRVSEGGRDYWMPVSAEVLADMQKKLGKGGAFTAYVRLLGESGSRWIFIVDGFNTVSRNP